MMMGHPFKPYANPQDQEKVKGKFKFPKKGKKKGLGTTKKMKPMIPNLMGLTPKPNPRKSQ
jgi:hypothetical protein